MTKCKNCQIEGKLEEIKDYKYQSDEGDPVEIIDILKCLKCGCIHWEDEEKVYYEYIVKLEEVSNDETIGNWAIDNSVNKVMLN